MRLPARYILLTSEGWYYLLVLAFIIGGAVLREVNLLVVLAGMMIGPLVFSWRWVMVSLASLAPRRRLPARISAGDPLVVEIEIANQRRRLTSWAIGVSDRLERLEPRGAKPTTQIEAAVPAIRPGLSATTSYRCLLTRRGRYEFGPLRLSTQFPFGLVTASERFDEQQTLIVTPRLGRLSRKWEQWIEAEHAGMHRNSPRRGMNEGDFYGMREWRAGDSQRWIHWRTSARLNELAVRQLEEQRSAEVSLLLDLWLPPQPTDGALGNVEVAVSLAATAVSDICRRSHNHVSLAVHAKERRRWSSPASSGLAQEVLAGLATVEPAESDNLAPALAELLQSAAAQARLIVFSTRKVDLARLSAAIDAPPALQALVAQCIWVDVANDDLSGLFTLD